MSGGTVGTGGSADAIDAGRQATARAAAIVMRVKRFMWCPLSSVGVPEQRVRGHVALEADALELGPPREQDRGAVGEALTRCQLGLAALRARLEGAAEDEI